MDDENEGKTMQEALQSHVCDLVALLDEMDPLSEEYATVKEAIETFGNILIRMDEIQLKYGNEVDQRNFERQMKHLELDAANEARQAEQKLKLIAEKELRRWHTIDAILRGAAIGVSILSAFGFLWTAWVQTRMNYADNVYDASPAAKAILSAIGKMVQIQRF